MNFEQIEDHWETQKLLLQFEVDKLAAERVRVLVKRMSPFRITKILFGNGTFTFDGPNFAVVYDDESRGELPIVELLYYGQYRNFVWTPADMTPRIDEALNELVRLCDWWVDTTGGEDVSFPENADA